MTDISDIVRSSRWTTARSLRFILVVALGVTLLLLETKSVFGIKVGFAWRSLLLGAGAIIAFPISGAKYPKFVLYGAIVALANLTAFGSQYEFLAQAILTMKALFLPVVFIALLRSRLDEIFLGDLVLAFSFMILLSCLPYYFGLLTSNIEVLDLEMFGGKEAYFVGPFQNTHSAAVSLALAATVFLFFARNAVGVLKSTFLLACFAIATALLLATYIRTGYIIFLFGAGVIWIQQLKKNPETGRVRTIFTLVGTLVLVVVLGVVVVANDPVLIARLWDINRYQTETSWENVGSGRLLFAYVALTAWWEADLLHKLFGIGSVDAITYMKSHVGQAIIAHNLFVDSLVQTGIIGFGAFFLMLKDMYKEVVQSMSLHRSYELAFVFFGSYILYSAVQGSHLFTLDAYFAVALVLSRRLCERSA